MFLMPRPGETPEIPGAFTPDTSPIRTLGTPPAIWRCGVLRSGGPIHSKVMRSSAVAERQAAVGLGGAFSRICASYRRVVQLFPMSRVLLSNCLKQLRYSGSFIRGARSNPART